MTKFFCGKYSRSRVIVNRMGEETEEDKDGRSHARVAGGINVATE